MIALPGPAYGFAPAKSIPTSRSEGRYLTLNLEVHSSDFHRDPQNPQVFKTQQGYDPGYVTLAAENGQLVAHRTDHPSEMTINSWAQRANRGDDIFILSSPVAFFVPEHAEAPRVVRGDELWAEVTVPKKARLALFNSPSNAATNGRRSLIGNRNRRELLPSELRLSLLHKRPDPLLPVRCPTRFSDGAAFQLHLRFQCLVPSAMQQTLGRSKCARRPLRQ